MTKEQVKRWWHAVPTWQKVGTGLAVFALFLLRLGMELERQLDRPTRIEHSVDSLRAAQVLHEAWGNTQLNLINRQRDSVLVEVRSLTRSVNALAREVCIDRAERERSSARACAAIGAR